MCFISAYWAIESVPTEEVLMGLLSSGPARGMDGFGTCIIKPNGRANSQHRRTHPNVVDPNYEVKMGDKVRLNRMIDDIQNVVRIDSKNIQVGDIHLSNFRAIPETEAESSVLELQPIMEEGFQLVHNGGISNHIVEELREKVENKFVSISSGAIDSEAILWSYYLHSGDIKKAVEYLVGGLAFILVDQKYQHKLYAVCNHNPLFCGYVVGHGMFFASSEDAIWRVISRLRGKDTTRCNTKVWEDYYCQEIPENTIVSIDTQTGQREDIKFTPRYITNNYDPLTKKKSGKEKVLVSLSGGLDSSATAVLLHLAGYDVTAVHFMYGHVGEQSEFQAARRVCEMSGIGLHNLKVMHIQKPMQEMGFGMLLDKNVPVNSGDPNYIKTTVAWAPFRNGIFASYLGALAERYITQEDYDKVYIAGGFLNLSESGVYPDNTERFVRRFQEFAVLSSIIGTKIEPLFCCSNLLKREICTLLDGLDIFEMIATNTISCDRPRMHLEGCSYKGWPACGSGILSHLAFLQAGLEDPRKYYELDDDPGDLLHGEATQMYVAYPEELINRLNISDEGKERLLNRLVKK